ncbi:CsgE family curli-type amyloid fiber assembly protein [Marivirga arenosa]|uniref:Curli production assembly/transport component CsgE n=1 Tax=Marivirga arenosa TaxID=3059076 RepID=A0AA51ZV09_9BACT|nr:CsgE family curli-type amyloid fiber assembly protein [Marivirga sp. BKB1-2]WNB16932.1 CsgE family curli-type amyloid fiber assembly protein [Marivirga sp. BKB1-2]
MKTITFILFNLLIISTLNAQGDSLLIQKLKAAVLLKQDTPKNVEEIDQLEIEINELIVNETMTKAGNDFHELFYSKWVWPDQSNQAFIIVIKEKPLRGNMTQISIKVNDMLIFEMPLQARYDYLESIAEIARERTQGFINNYREILKSLEGEDIKGSGIF